MANQRYSTMTTNLMFMFCVVAIMSNLVAINDATRELKNPIDKKEVMMGGEKGGGADETDLNKNYEIYYKNQLPISFPVPFPFPPLPFPGLLIPPYPPINIPGIPFPLPPKNIPAVREVKNPLDKKEVMIGGEKGGGAYEAELRKNYEIYCKNQLTFSFPVPFPFPPLPFPGLPTPPYPPMNIPGIVSPFPPVNIPAPLH